MKDEWHEKLLNKYMCITRHLIDEIYKISGDEGTFVKIIADVADDVALEMGESKLS